MVSSSICQHQPPSAPVIGSAALGLLVPGTPRAPAGSADLRRHAGGDHLPEVEHDHAVANRSDQIHVVVDQHHARSRWPSESISAASSDSSSTESPPAGSSSSSSSGSPTSARASATRFWTAYGRVPGRRSLSVRAADSVQSGDCPVAQRAARRGPTREAPAARSRTVLAGNAGLRPSRSRAPSVGGTSRRPGGSWRCPTLARRSGRTWSSASTSPVERARIRLDEAADDVEQSGLPAPLGPMIPSTSRSATLDRNRIERRDPAERDGHIANRQAGARVRLPLHARARYRSTARMPILDTDHCEFLIERAASAAADRSASGGPLESPTLTDGSASRGRRGTRASSCSSIEYVCSGAGKAPLRTSAEYSRDPRHHLRFDLARSAWRTAARGRRRSRAGRGTRAPGRRSPGRRRSRSPGSRSAPSAPRRPPPGSPRTRSRSSPPPASASASRGRRRARARRCGPGPVAAERRGRLRRQADVAHHRDPGLDDRARAARRWCRRARA